MRGRHPKPEEQRQRRNKSHKKAIGGKRERDGVPELPAGREWHALTVAWWADIWASEMEQEYVQADVHGLYRLAVLIDHYWKGNIALANEIRLEQTAYGLSPLDRKRLEWEVRRVEATKPAKAPPRRMIEEDPRQKIFAVK